MTSMEFKENGIKDGMIGGENKEQKSAKMKKNLIFFKIYFNFNTHMYYLQDMGAGYGTFVKTNDNIIIKENTIINIGETYLIFSFDKKDMKTEQFQNTNNLYLKIYSNEIEYEPLFLCSLKKDIYKLGRSDQCDISIDDGMLSRVHCILFFFNNAWYIKDGNEEGNQSTNGTWVYASEEIEIFEGMIFKSNSCNFVCKYQ